MSEKALKACADYARLNAEIRRLTHVLGDSLSKCHGVNGALLTPHFPFDEHVEMRREADCTHLKAAYTPDVEEGFYDRSAVYMDDAEICEYLAECPHCLAAHEAIQARKAARRSLGATKRFITMIGRGVK